MPERRLDTTARTLPATRLSLHSLRNYIGRGPEQQLDQQTYRSKRDHIFRRDLLD